jgi:hypothetical protein
MRALRQTRGGALILWCVAGGALVLAAASSPAGLEALRQRSQEVRLQLAAEKARVLREEADAVVLREQIEKLYRELDHVVSSKPTVARLQADLDRLEETIKTQTAPGANARPEGKATP